MTQADIPRVEPWRIGLAGVAVAMTTAALALPRTAAGVQAQVGDGPEYLLAAQTGALAHAPGYPIFTSLLELVAQFTGTPGLAGYAALATCNALIACLAFGALGALLTRLCGSPLVGAALGVAVVLFEPSLAAATDLEVFALHQAFAVAVVATSLWARGRRRGSLVVLGLVCGLAGAHHPSIVFFAPVVLWATWGETPSSRLARLSALLAGALVGLSPYLLLPGRFATAPHLAFGDTRTLAGVVAHALRVGYGTFSLHGAEGAPAAGVWSFLAELSSGATLAAAGVVAALVLLARRRADARLAAVLACLGLHLVFYLRVPITSDELSLLIARRFFVAGALASALVAAEAWRVLAWRPAPVVAAGVVLTGLLPSLVQLPSTLAAADARADGVAALYLRTLERDLPAGSVFFAHDDFEAFGGLVRYPDPSLDDHVVWLIPARLSWGWYVEQLDVLAPFARQLSPPQRRDVAALARAALADGRRVFSVTAAPPSGFVARPRGLAWEWFPRGAAPAGGDLLDGILRACRDLDEVDRARPAARPWSRRVAQRFATPVAQAAKNVPDDDARAPALRAAARAIAEDRYADAAAACESRPSR